MAKETAKTKELKEVPALPESRVASVKVPTQTIVFRKEDGSIGEVVFIKDKELPIVKANAIDALKAFNPALKPVKIFSIENGKTELKVTEEMLNDVNSEAVEQLKMFDDITGTAGTEVTE